MMPVQTLTACPHCGSGRTVRVNQAAQKSMLAGSMMGAAYILSLIHI